MMYNFTTWIKIEMIVCFIGFFMMATMLSVRAYKKWNDAIYISIAIVLSGVVWGTILLYPIGIISNNVYIKSNLAKKIILNMNEYKYKNEYKCLEVVKTSVEDGYDGDFNSLESVKYYYDFLEINIIEKSINISEFISFLTNGDITTIVEIQSKLHKVTETKTINGVIENNVDNNVISYKIGNYVLGKDEKGEISTLIDNNRVNLSIVYDKELCKDKKTITRYKVTNVVRE